MPQMGEIVAERYRIERPLSKGGMGSVFVAEHTQTGRRFALKLMSTELAGDDQAEARFMREARLAGAINHPSIIEVYDVGHHGGHPYMVMKLLEGESLGERLKRGAIPPNEAMALLLPVLDGVAAAHAQNIVHRDLKPDNIFLWAAAPGTVEPKVLDFGISKLVDADKQTQKLTQTGMAVGTPLYMSPEQIRGERDVDARTDIYSLGVILYEMLTGQVPYTGRTYADLVLKVITGGATPPSQVNGRVPKAFDDVVACAIAVDRAHRYADVASLASDLRAIDVGRPPAIAPRISQASAPASLTPFATEASTVTPTMTVPGRVSPARYVTIGAAALVMAVVATWMLATSDSPTPSAAAPPPEAIEAAAEVAAPAPTPTPTPVVAPTGAPAASADDPTGPTPRETNATPKTEADTRERAAEERREHRHAEHRATTAIDPNATSAPQRSPADRTPVIRITTREDSRTPSPMEPARVPALDAPKPHRTTPSGTEELIDPFK